jgi:hypothetical protein
MSACHSLILGLYSLLELEGFCASVLLNGSSAGAEKPVLAGRVSQALISLHSKS